VIDFTDNPEGCLITIMQKLDEFIIMPDHLHGILIIKNTGVQYIEPLRHQYQKIIPKSIGSIVRSYKASVTRWCNKNQLENFKWQRNYYERIITNQKELKNIRNYIKTNPET